MAETYSWGPFSKKPNILIILTDQQRSFQHFPEDWIRENLPHITYLQENGVTFKNGMTNSTACSPSRATLFTGTYPSLHGVKKVNQELYLNNQLPTPGKLTTLGQIMQSAGYDVAYKGKWHMNDDFVNTSRVRPFDPYQQQVENQTMETRYFFPGWTSPDFGTEEQAVGTASVAPGMDSYMTTLGGPAYSPEPSPMQFADNDNRIVHGSVLDPNQESAIRYLKGRTPGDERPFCLIVALSNPHDIWVYPYSYKAAGYDENNWKNYTGFEMPVSYNESLATKPACQQFFLDTFQGGPLDNTDGVALESIKFYAYLHTIPDRLTGDLLATLRDQGLEDNTLVIRLADHGEMGMAHGGLRQKENQCYRETINVPIIFSNPQMQAKGARSDVQVGLIDILPTLAEIAGIKDEIGSEIGSPPTTPHDPLEDRHKYAVIQGYSFASELRRHFTLRTPAAEDAVVINEQFLFATDDVDAWGDVTTTSIRAIVEKDWKYAVYYTADYDATDNPNGVASNFEYELYSYNVLSGELEMNNLLQPDPTMPPATYLNSFVYRERKRLHDALTKLLEKNHAKPQNWPVFD